MRAKKFILGLVVVTGAMVGGAMSRAIAAPKLAPLPATTCTVCAGTFDFLTGTIMIVCKTGASNCNGTQTCVALATQTRSGALSVDIGCDTRA